MESLCESGNIELLKYFLPFYLKFVETEEYKTMVNGHEVIDVKPGD